MNFSNYLFYTFGALAALSALAILWMKNVLHAALLLIMCLLSLAGIYIFLKADFLAVAQIMVYAGGILVLMIFGIILSSRLAGKPLQTENSRVFQSLFLCALFFVLFIYALTSFSFQPVISSSEIRSVQEIGFALMTQYAAPFELAGVLLLITLLGASVIASFQNQNDKHAR